MEKEPQLHALYSTVVAANMHKLRYEMRKHNLFLVHAKANVIIRRRRWQQQQWQQSDIGITETKF